MGVVFFISPRGEIISGEINHINTIIKYSDKFGYSRERIGLEGPDGNNRRPG